MKKKAIFIVLVYFCLITLLTFSFSHSFFSSTSSSTNNVFAAASVFPTPTTQPGDVIINELNWAGSSIGTSDEWIELRNTTNHSINISNWQLTKWLTNPSGHEALMLTIPATQTIAAGGLYLIADKSPGNGSALTVTPDDIDSSVALDNSNLQIKLYSGTWNSGGLLLDTAGNKNTPLAGEHSKGNNPTFFSMERNAIPGDGSIAGSWHTATTSVNLNSDSGKNKGTPKATND